MKNVTLFFDFEGKWGMPHKVSYDLCKTTRRLLKVLGKYDVKAVFFVVGKIIEKYPDLIKEIANEGHEIAMHGYAHDHLDKLSSDELKIFDANLTKIEEILEELTGKRPTGFRSPYLMGPKFYTPELYKILRDHNYKWVSNRELRYPVELFRPDRLCFPPLWGKSKKFMRLLFVLLNPVLIVRERFNGKNNIKRIIDNIRWLNSGKKPFKRRCLLEVPLYSPMDCDLLGLPKPDEDSSEESISYAKNCLVGGAKRKGNLYILNFHDWIMGTSNRISLFEEVIRLIKYDDNNKFLTTRDLMELDKKIN